MKNKGKKFVLEGYLTADFTDIYLYTEEEGRPVWIGFYLKDFLDTGKKVRIIVEEIESPDEKIMKIRNVSGTNVCVKIKEEV